MLDNFLRKGILLVMTQTIDKLAVGLILCTECLPLAERHLLLLRRCYTKLDHLIVIVPENDEQYTKLVTTLFEGYHVEILQSTRRPIILKYQDIVNAFLSGKTSHLIITEPDAVPIRFDYIGRDWAGDQITYCKKKLLELYELFRVYPGFSNHFAHLWTKGALVATNGSWNLYSRRLLELVQPLFYHEQEDDRWDHAVYPQEHFFCFWLHIVLRQEPFDDLDQLTIASYTKENFGKALYLCARSWSSICSKELAVAHVVHPAKRQAKTILHYLAHLPLEDADDIRNYLEKYGSQDLLCDL